MKSKTVSLTIIEKLDYLMWDYNISAQDSYEVLIGSKPMAGHYDQFSLFRKVLEAFPWFTIMDLLFLLRIKELLTEQVTTKLRSKQLQKRYEYIRDRKIGSFYMVRVRISSVCLRLFLFMLIAVLFSCSHGTQPIIGAISGVVTLVNETGGAASDPIDFSNIKVSLYAPVTLDTALIRINNEYPNIGIQMTQETEFDHRYRTPLYSTLTDDKGHYAFSSVSEGAYNIVFEKENYGWGYMYNVETNKIYNGELFPEIVLSSLHYNNVTFRENRHYIVTSSSTTIDNLTIENSSWLRMSTNANLRVLTKIECPSQGYSHFLIDNNINPTSNSILLNTINGFSIKNIVFRDVAEALNIVNCTGNISYCRFINCSSSLTIYDSDIEVSNTIASKLNQAGSLFAADSANLIVLKSILLGGNIALDIRNGSVFNLSSSYICSYQCIYLDKYTEAIIEHNLLTATNYIIKSMDTYLIHVCYNDIVGYRGIYIRKPLLTAPHKINYNNINTTSFALENTPNLMGNYREYNFDAKQNYFYTTSAEEIADKIFDLNDQPTWLLFIFQFAPFLTANVSEAGIPE